MITLSASTFRFALALAAVMPLAACTNQSSAPAPAATPATTAPAAADPGVPATSAPVTPAITAPATPAQAGPIVPPAGPAPIAGTDYVEIAGGQPYLPLNGKIEVVEVFGYVCPACANFQPLVSAWKHKLPADVRFTYLPAPFGADWIPYAKGFYVAESMGLVDQTHDLLINAIHIQNTMPGEGDKPTDAAVAAFYGQHGADPKQFLDQMHSFATETKLNRGKQFMLRSGVDSTPTMVVNGKYRIQGRKQPEEVLRLVDHLIAQQRAAGTPAAQ